MCFRYHCGFSNISLCIWLHWVLLASHRIFHLRSSLWGLQFSSVHLLSRADSLRPHEPQHTRPPCLSPNPRAYLNSCPLSHDAIQPSHPLSSPFPLAPIPPIFRVFSNELTLPMRWPKYWSFSFSISPSKEHPGLISFRMDWLDLLAIQGTLKSLLQHHSSKASILRRSAFFRVQLSHPYMTTGKTIALTGTDLCWQSNVSAFEYAI